MDWSNKSLNRSLISMNLVQVLPESCFFLRISIEFYFKKQEKPSNRFSYWVFYRSCEILRSRSFEQQAFATSRNPSRAVVRSAFLVLRQPLTASLHLPKGSASASRQVIRPTFSPKRKVRANKTEGRRFKVRHRPRQLKNRYPKGYRWLRGFCRSWAFLRNQSLD